MYAVHFYAATHKDDLRNKVINAIKAGTPVFVSEFSICDASGNGGIDYDSAGKWKELINNYNLSFAGWSLCNKGETSALIKSGVSRLSGFTTSDLSETGIWLRNFYFRKVIKKTSHRVKVYRPPIVRFLGLTFGGRYK